MSSDISKLVEVMLQQQRIQQEQHAEQMKMLQEQNANLLVALKSETKNVTSIPAFTPFDSTAELWSDYWNRYLTFVEANSIPEPKLATVFLTNQSKVTYKLLSSYASQLTPPVQVKELSMEQISAYMKLQFDPTRYIVRERYKFWSELQRKPGETIQELAARIRQDAVTCNFADIKDPQDEALRTRFICSVKNEAVLKALFRIDDKDLTFAKAVSVATETEDAARVAKDTVYGDKEKNSDVYKISNRKHRASSSNTAKTSQKDSKHSSYPFPKGTCARCGQTSHGSKDCPEINTTCTYCLKKGHIESACLQKKRGVPKKVKVIYSKPPETSVTSPDTIKVVSSASQVHQDLLLKGNTLTFEVDTGAGDNFCSLSVWEQLGKPSLDEPVSRYEGATGDPLPVEGTFQVKAQLPHQPDSLQNLQFTVVRSPKLNLLGRDAIRKLKIDVTALMNNCKPETVKQVFNSLQPDKQLQQACIQVCEELPDIFKPELGCLKDFELEVKFKDDAKPIFCKPRIVPFAIQEDLVHAYEAGIKRGVWKRANFNAYGTPVVPIRKAVLPGQTQAKLRVCGDYSVTVNSQLEDHRQPVPLPGDLMQKLGRGYGFSKIDLADAYNQIMLAPESQKRLALSTHQGVLLQQLLPFGIKSAPGYFQHIMEQLTSDLKGVAVYLDDLLVSGDNAQEHLQNLRALLKRLDEKGLRCRREKCVFAQPVVEYLGHLLSHDGIAKGPKVDAVQQMPRPHDVASLKSFIGSVQFYSKFIPDLATITEPLHYLTKRDTAWTWGAEQEAAFQKLKDQLCTDNVLAHFDPKEEIGISCDASEVGLGAVLFHRYKDGSERPIANASKTLTDTQRRYSQIQKEALSHRFRSSQVSSIPVRQTIPSRYGSSAAHITLWPQQGNSITSRQSTGKMGAHAQSVPLHD